ncbi:MAG: hypothetical protein ACRCTY_07340, partial [Candidatus Adiutrix sp.]
LENKKMQETQPTVGPRGDLAFVRKNGPNWELIHNAQVISSGVNLHLAPAFSPQGTLVASISEENETSIFAFANSEKQRLIKGRDIAISPAFSPDGQTMAYVGNQSGLAQIYLSPSQVDEPKLLTPLMTRNTDPAWSPDGQKIVFVCRDTDICLIDSNGQNLAPLTQNQGFNLRPGFSPDGSLIVFSSDRNGFAQLFVMTPDGKNQTPLIPQFNQSQHQPFWSPHPLKNFKITP